MRQRKTKDPCPGCFLHRDLCICARVPRLALRTRVSLVVHARELKRTTNTGRLAVQALANSAMYTRGVDRAGLDLSGLITSEYRSLLFFPTEDARELSPELVAESALPIHLIVPDGNWRQASKVHYRHAELKGLPRVKISAPNSARRHLRAETSPEGMATLQAIAHALRIIEGEEAAAPLLGLYEAKLTNTLRGRGQLSDTT